LVPDDWQTWRDVRLASLADAPHAFGSSLALEQQFDEAAWRARLANGTAAVAFVGEDPVGTIAAYVPEDGNDPMLVAAWVRAAERGSGVGDALVAEMLDWACERGYGRVYLRVADGNDSARKLFLRNGFTPTGVRMPLESDPDVGTEFLVQELRADGDG
jgi:RimJ/RimL family protein N-acetyltransferase